MKLKDGLYLEDLHSKLVHIESTGNIFNDSFKGDGIIYNYGTNDIVVSGEFNSLIGNSTVEDVKLDIIDAYLGKDDLFLLNTNGSFFVDEIKRRVLYIMYIYDESDKAYYDYRKKIQNGEMLRSYFLLTGEEYKGNI